MEEKVRRYTILMGRDGGLETTANDGGYWVTHDDFSRVVAERETEISQLKGQVNDLRNEIALWVMDIKDWAVRAQQFMGEIRQRCDGMQRATVNPPKAAGTIGMNHEFDRMMGGNSMGKTSSLDDWTSAMAKRSKYLKRMMLLEATCPSFTTWWDKHSMEFRDTNIEEAARIWVAALREQKKTKRRDNG
jgi:hypothetical protein